MLIELNIDGLVGPSHHYGGLGVGNLASHQHAHQVSNPQAAALEGLEKMWRLAQLGVPQAFLLPPLRPNLPWLKALGFGGELRDQLKAAGQAAPRILSAAYSSAFMWMANAATVSPAADCHDKKLHMSIANLASNLHRSQEAGERLLQLRSLFEDVPNVCVHSGLPSSLPFRDEGAANHMRLCGRGHDEGLEIFVHGDGAAAAHDQPFTSRQALSASQAVARRHHLAAQNTYFLAQNPAAIAAGVFHNDVIATSHENLFLYHEDAFENADETLARLESDFNQRFEQPLVRRCILRSEISLEEAVQTYLFNSQIVSWTQPAGEGRAGSRAGLQKRVDVGMLLMAPSQCKNSGSARQIIQSLIDDPAVPISAVEYVALDQSMANGGGPACVRLRVPLTAPQLAKFPTNFLLGVETHQALQAWIKKWYPAKLELADLIRPEFAQHAFAAVRAGQDIMWEGFSTNRFTPTI